MNADSRGSDSRLSAFISDRCNRNFAAQPGIFLKNRGYAGC